MPHAYPKVQLVGVALRPKSRRWKILMPARTILPLMKTPQTDPEGLLGRKENSEVARLLRRSHQFRHPRKLRRAQTGTHARAHPLWTLEELKLVGTMPDRELPSKFGRTPGPVPLHRSLTFV